MSEGINTYIQPWEAQPTTMSERITDSSLPLGRNLDLVNTKLLPEVLKIHFVHFQHRIKSGLITSKDDLQASQGLITSKGNLQVSLNLSNLRASPGFMLKQPVSPTMLELPLSRDLDLDHCSSLHHRKMQVKSTKSNSIFQRKHTTSQIASGNIFFLRCTHCHVRLLPATPRSTLPINKNTCLI